MMMAVLTVGYIHLMIFAALVVILSVYLLTRCCFENDGPGVQFTPVKLWVFIDEGIFSLLDALDEADMV